MKRTRLVPAISLSLFILFAAIYAWRLSGGEVPLTVISDTLTVVFAAAAAGLALKAGRAFEPGEPQRRVWLVWATGMTMWAVAEIIWACYEIILGQEVPYPSLADALWAVAYIPLFAGLWLQYHALGVQAEPRRRVMVLLIYAALALLACGLVLWPMFSNPGESSALELFLGVLYPVGDLCLAFIATLSLLVLGRSWLGRPWLYIVISMLVFAVSDLFYVYADWNGLYAPGENLLSGFIDVTYMASYILATIGTYRQATLGLPSLE